MRIDLNARTTINLDKDGLIKLPRSRGDAILCTHGAVWVTEDNLAHDIELQEGDRYVSKGAGPVIVQAFEASAFRVVSSPAMEWSLTRIAHRIVIALRMPRAWRFVAS